MTLTKTLDPSTNRALASMLKAITDTVREMKGGAPEGPIYAALQANLPSMTLAHYEAIIGALIDTGRVCRRGHQLFPGTTQPTT